MLLVARARAPAAEHPAVELAIVSCETVAGDEVRRIVAVELGTLLSDGAEATADRTRVEVRCEASLVQLRVDDPITGKTLGRAIDLEQVVAGARSRLLALAICELVVASWTELEVNPKPAAVPAGPAASPAARRAALASVERRQTASAPLKLRLLAVASGLSFWSGTGFLWGGGARAAEDLPYHLGWSADALVHHGDSAVSLGVVTVDALSVGGALLLHWDWNRLSLRAGAGARFGAAHLNGKPRLSQVQASGGWGAWGGPNAVLALSAIPMRRLIIELVAESGYAALAVEGLVGNKNEVAVEGPWLGIQLGIGFY